MRCRICGKRIKKNNAVHIRGGYICKECLSKLPVCAMKSAGSLSAGQIREILKLAIPPDGMTFASYGLLAAGDSYIYFSGKMFRISDLQSIRLNFHPEKDISDYGKRMATGHVTLIIETKSPHYLFEDTVEENFYAGLEYRIVNGEIVFDFPQELSNICNAVSMAIKAGGNGAERFYREITGQYQEQRRKEEKRKEEKRKESYKRSSYSWSQTGTGNGRSRSAGSNRTENHTGSPIEEAEKILGISKPYDKSKLRTARNKLLKLYHPDEGKYTGSAGNPAMVRAVNDAYNLLLEYSA